MLMCVNFRVKSKTRPRLRSGIQNLWGAKSNHLKPVVSKAEPSRIQIISNTWRMFTLLTPQAKGTRYGLSLRRYFNWRKQVIRWKKLEWLQGRLNLTPMPSAKYFRKTIFRLQPAHTSRWKDIHW